MPAFNNPPNYKRLIAGYCNTAREFVKEKADFSPYKGKIYHNLGNCLQFSPVNCQFDYDFLTG
jgi:hypothetical protein